MVATRKIDNPDWKFMWDRYEFDWLPGEANPKVFIAKATEAIEEERRLKELVVFNNAILDVSKTVRDKRITGSWSGVDHSSTTTIYFKENSTFDYIYKQSNGYKVNRNGEYDVFQKDDLIRLRTSNGKYQFVQFVSDDAIIISPPPHYEEYPEDFVFYPDTIHIMIRDGLASSETVSDAEREDLSEEQRKILFNLMLESGMHIPWSD